MSRLVVIGRFYDLSDALCAVSMLEAQGIVVFAFDRALTSLDWHWMPMLGGCRIVVLEQDVEVAQMLLQTGARRREVESVSERFLCSFWRNAAVSLVRIFFITGLQPIPFWMRRRRWKDESEPREVA